MSHDLWYTYWGQVTLEYVQTDLQESLAARATFGLMPAAVCTLNGSMRAAIGFGPDKRTAEVKRRYDIVLEIANDHLPPGVAPMETWEYADNGPRRLA